MLGSCAREGAYTMVEVWEDAGILKRVWKALLKDALNRGLKEGRHDVDILGRKIHYTEGKVNKVGAGLGRTPGMFKEQTSMKEQKE